MKLKNEYVCYVCGSTEAHWLFCYGELEGKRMCEKCRIEFYLRPARTPRGTVPSADSDLRSKDR